MEQVVLKVDEVIDYINGRIKKNKYEWRKAIRTSH